MADWRIVTPTRAPTSDELVNNVVFQVPNDESTVSARIMYMGGVLIVQLFFSDPQVIVRYQFSDGKWLNKSSEPIDITTMDLTIPEEIVAAATVKSSYFDLIAYEKGTTACKLAVVNEAKTLIRNALINKGVDVPDATPFRQYAGKVGEIQSGQSFEWKTQTGVSGYAQINSEVMPLAGPPVYSYDLDLSDNQEYNAVFLVLEETYYSTGDLRPVGAFYINGTWKAELITLTDKSSKSHLSFEDYGGYGKVYFVPMVLPNV